jgi:hypothetical protein
MLWGCNISVSASACQTSTNQTSQSKSKCKELRGAKCTNVFTFCTLESVIVQEIFQAEPWSVAV